MKSIRVEKIDALIASLESTPGYGEYQCNDACEDEKLAIVRTLRGLEKESEEMIPLSVIDALIKDFKEITKYEPLVDPIKNYLRTVIIPHLEQVKKELTKDKETKE